jgi:4-aminobutyrate aminotransferase-like enzyme
MLPELTTPIPGPRSLTLGEALRQYESHNVTYVSPDFPVFWQRAHGVNVWDVDGNRFLDCTSGFGVAGLGYTPEKIVAAMTEQIARLYHAMGDVHPSVEKVELCRLLSECTFEKWGVGPGKVLLANSGGEAVESALKTAMVATHKPGIIAFEGSYHGLGYGPLTVTGRQDFQKRFRSQLAGFAHFAPFPSGPGISAQSVQTALKEIFRKNPIGAILVEPIQARGGEVIPPDWFLPMLRHLAYEHEALLIFDEIYTGFYRTGKRFACDHWAVVPDVVCVGKALTSGFPLSACVGRAKIMDLWPVSDGEALHTSTFLGNPLGCRMAITSLRLLEETGSTGQIAARGEFLLKGLQALEGPRLRHARGKGLLAGLEVVRADGSPDAAATGRIVCSCLKKGVILLGGGVRRNVLSFSPPFAITEEEIAFVLKTVQQAYE